MDHHQIETNEVIERYVQHRLAADERLAFQEHYFTCDKCFEQVQTTAQFVAGVRDASQSGALAPDRARAQGAASSWFGWFNPVLALSVAASLLLATVVLWLWFSKVPAYQQEIVRERQAREESERNLAAAKNQADESRRQLELERAERERLAAELQAKSQLNDNQRPGPDVIAQATLPTVTLESTRDSQGSENQLTIPADAKSAVLLIPVGPSDRFQSFRVELLTESGRLVETFTKTRMRNGAVMLSVSTQRLQSQKYLVRIYGVKDGQSSLLGEHDLLVRKR